MLSCGYCQMYAVFSQNGLRFIQYRELLQEIKCLVVAFAQKYAVFSQNDLDLYGTLKYFKNLNAQLWPLSNVCCLFTEWFRFIQYLPQLLWTMSCWLRTLLSEQHEPGMVYKYIKNNLLNTLFHCIWFCLQRIILIAHGYPHKYSSIDNTR